MDISSLEPTANQSATDKAAKLIWDATSLDYLQHRPGYPDEFFRVLQQLGVGLEGQDILDLGTGTGAWAVQFALQKARVTATDISEGQITAANEAAKRAGVRIDFKVAPSEETGLPDRAFDVVSSSMSWGYFDLSRMLIEVPRLLRRPGLLLLSSLIWERGRHPVAIHSENLIEKYNPTAGRSFRRDEPEIVPSWSHDHFRLRSYHSFTTTLPFTRESWRGRLRASRFIAAALPSNQVNDFDAEHRKLLERVAPVQFDVPHQIRLQVLEVKLRDT